MNRWLRQVGLLAAVGLVAVAAAAVVTVVLAGGDINTGPDRAQVLGTFWPVAVSVVLVGAWAWRLRGRRDTAAVGTATPQQVAAAADRLAEQTLLTWSAQASHRGLTTPMPARVRWGWAGQNLGAPREQLNRSPALPVDPPPLSEGTADVLASGTVTRLQDEVYQRLRHGRLVLIGGPGAGKTGAMLLLLLAALKHRRGVSSEHRDDVPVPVWLTLGSWNPAERPLRAWVIESLRRDHPYLDAADFGPDAAARLFDTGRIALFLDGLDELPDALRPAAARRLREEAGGLRLVLTSRPDEYRDTLTAGEQLPNTAVIHLAPVSPAAAVDYLLADRTPHDASRWEAVVNEIRNHPDGVLAQALNTPLTLSLARAAHTLGAPHAVGPDRMLGPDLNTVPLLREHLLDQLIVTAYPDSRERVHARYWLGWLAHHLNSDPGPQRNLAWWDIHRALLQQQWRLGLGLAFGLGGGLLLGLPFVTSWPLGFGPVFVLVLILILGLGLGLGFGLGYGFGSRPGSGEEAARRLSPRLPTTSELRRGFRIGLMFAFGFGLVIGLWLGPGRGLACGLGAGLVMWLATFLPPWGDPTSDMLDVSPVQTHREDRQYRAVVGLVLGAALGLAAGIMFWLVIGIGLGPAIESGLGFGLVSGGLVLLGTASGQLQVAELVLLVGGWRTGGWRTGRRPRRVRFMPLLEQALDRQVLRQAGAFYQFRHAELQDRLAAWFAAEHAATREPPGPPPGG